MSKKFTMEQLSQFTGLEEAKLAKLLLKLHKNAVANGKVLTKKAQGIGALDNDPRNLGMLPIDVRTKARNRRPPELFSERGPRDKPRPEAARMFAFTSRGIPPIINKIKSSSITPPNAKDVIGLLTRAMSPDVQQTPGMAGTYISQALYFMFQNEKVWRTVMDAPNSAEWTRIMWLAKHLPGVAENIPGVKGM